VLPGERPWPLRPRKGRWGGGWVGSEAGVPEWCGMRRVGAYGGRGCGQSHSGTCGRGAREQQRAHQRTRSRNRLRRGVVRDHPQGWGSRAGSDPACNGQGGHSGNNAQGAPGASAETTTFEGPAPAKLSKEVLTAQGGKDVRLLACTHKEHRALGRVNKEGSKEVVKTRRPRAALDKAKTQAHKAETLGKACVGGHTNKLPTKPETVPYDLAHPTTQANKDNTVGNRKELSQGGKTRPKGCAEGTGGGCG